MKSADQFWLVISNYNQHTFPFQIALSLLILLSVTLALNQKFMFFPKLVLAVSNLYISLVFFLYFDRGSLARFFAAPLFLMVGILFLYDIIKNNDTSFGKFSGLSIPILLLILFYPLVSYLLGHRYPNQVLYILPCPLISLSIIIYSRYTKKSIFLMAIMIVWALTGIKAFIFDVLEDLILFITGIYGIYIIYLHIKNKPKISSDNVIKEVQ